MPSFKNTQKISKIEMSFSMYSFCPLGDDYYTNYFTIQFYPGYIIPDYCDIEYIVKRKELVTYREGGTSTEVEKLSIEDAVEFVYDTLMRYNPKKLVVESFVYDAVHFPVTVTRSSEEV
jgi:hypothetical protein